MKKETWGGRREGAGRPKQPEIRKRHCLVFLDTEWALIRRKAASKNMSPREYLFQLAEKDK